MTDNNDNNGIEISLNCLIVPVGDFITLELEISSRQNHVTYKDVILNLKHLPEVRKPIRLIHRRHKRISSADDDFEKKIIGIYHMRMKLRKTEQTVIKCSNSNQGK
jgi:hypothetical protein